MANDIHLHRNIIFMEEFDGTNHAVEGAPASTEIVVHFSTSIEGRDESGWWGID